MREIKFRAWFNGKNRMVYNLGFDDRSFITLDDPTLQEDEMPSVWDKDCIIDDSYYEGAFSYEIMQYTGLLDKNGKEIFEGDIVAFEDSDGGYEYPDVVVNTGIVEYGELRFYFTNRIAAEMDDFYIKDGRCDDVEVIGNIHENPELLENS